MTAGQWTFSPVPAVLRGSPGRKWTRWSPGKLALLGGYALWATTIVYSLSTGRIPRVFLLLLPAVVFVIHLVPRWAVIAAIPIATFGTVVLPAQLTQRSYLLLIGIAGLGVMTRRWDLRLRFHVPLVLLSLIVVVSAFLADGPANPYAFRNFAVLTAIGLLMSGAAALMRPPLTAVLYTLAAVGVAVALVVLVGWFENPLPAGDIPVADNLRRAYALGLNPNYLALVIVVGAIAAVGLALERQRYWMLLGTVPCLLSLPELKSRGPLVLIAFGVLWVVVSLRSRRWRRLAVVVGVLGLLMLFRPSVGQDLYRSVLGSRADLDLTRSDDFRLDVARFALDQGLDHPLLGVGYGQFPMTAGTQFAIAFPSAHNEYLHVFSELGFIGLALLILVILRVAQAARRCSIPVTSTAVLATYALAMLSMDTLYSLPTSMGVFVLAGAVVADSRTGLATGAEQKETRNDSEQCIRRDRRRRTVRVR